MAPVDSGVWIDMDPLGDGVGLQIGTPEEGHGEDLLQCEVVVGEPRPVTDGPLFSTNLPWTSPSNDTTLPDRLATHLYPSILASGVASHLMSPPQP